MIEATWNIEFLELAGHVLDVKKSWILFEDMRFCRSAKK